MYNASNRTYCFWLSYYYRQNLNKLEYCHTVIVKVLVLIKKKLNMI